MSKAITPCPSCGALGEAGKQCLFCGTTIQYPAVSDKIQTSIVVRNPTVSSEAFTSRISKYHKVSPWKHDLAEVSIGSLCGVINRNGDVVIPLNYEVVKIASNKYLVLDDILYDIQNQTTMRLDLRPIHGSLSVIDGLPGHLVAIDRFFPSESDAQGTDYSVIRDVLGTTEVIKCSIYDDSKRKIIRRFAKGRNAPWNFDFIVAAPFDGYIINLVKKGEILSSVFIPRSGEVIDGEDLSKTFSSLSRRAVHRLKLRYSNSDGEECIAAKLDIMSEAVETKCCSRKSGHGGVEKD